MLHPKTVKQAAESVRLQELTVEALVKKQRMHIRGISSTACQQGNQVVAATRRFNREAAKNGQNFRNLAVQPTVVSNQPTGGKFGIVEQRREAGLCFRCGDKYML